MIVYDWEKKVVDAVSSIKGSNLILDSFMYSLSSVAIGAMALVVLLLYLYLKNKVTTTLLISKVIAAFLLADLSSRFLFKYIFLRSRPKFLGEVCEQSYCYGFVSSHAADIFAIGTIFIFVNKRNSFWVIPLSVSVCFSRLYFNDHYPLDLIGGAFVGILAGVISNYSTLSVGNKLTRIIKNFT